MNGLHCEWECSVRMKSKLMQKNFFIVGVFVVHTFQTGNNNVKLFREYEIVTQKVDFISNKTF
jgi:hypothetical protein